MYLIFVDANIVTVVIVVPSTLMISKVHACLYFVASNNFRMLTHGATFTVRNLIGAVKRL